MAVVEVNRGGVDWYCVTESNDPTWRMSWDEFGIVQDLLQGTEEFLYLKSVSGGGVFEANTREELMTEIVNQGLEFWPEVETI